MNIRRHYRGGYQFAELAELASVIRFPNERILKDTDGVLKEIARHLPAAAGKAGKEGRG